MKRGMYFYLVFVLMMLESVAFADIGDWIDNHPEIAYSLRWQYASAGSYYDISESNKIAWPEWSSAQQQDLIDAHEDALAWLGSSNPYENLDETIVYPPTNLCDGDDTDPPETCVDEAYAWDLYIRWVAVNLAIETAGIVPWSITDYDTDELKLLLDSTSIMTRNIENNFTVGTEKPGHGSYIKRLSNLGSSLIAPPRYTLAFLAENNLIGTDRLDTIERVLQWASDNLYHFLGGYEYANMEDHWQYRGLPPVTRIIEGTNNEAWSSTFGHWTAGCHGTTGFMRNVLRAMNIPMRIATICGHSQAEFVTEGLYLDHGDDVYNSDFTGSWLPAGFLLIESETHLMWFGPDPYNHDYDSFCVPDNNIGHQVAVITGEAESCLDGEDNDDDGLTDCDDSECAPLSVFTQAKINGSDSAAEDEFGGTVDVDGNRIVVGAYENDGAGDNAGAAYVYAYTNGVGWTEEAKLVPSDIDADQEFGYAAAISGDIVVVSSDMDDAFRGSAYVFRRSPVSGWAEEAKLVPVEAVAGDRVGISVDVEDNLIAVGAFGDDSEKGAVYMFRSSGGSWVEEGILTASDGEAGDLFGYAVHISGNAVIVGAYAESSAADQAGAAYIFRYNGSAWIEEAKLTASDADTYQNYGWSVGLSGDAAIVGAMYNDEVAAMAGAAYVYRFNGSTWTEEDKLTASDAWANEYFGVGVSIDGDFAVVGAYGEHHLGNIKSTAYTLEDNIGAAYVFEHNGGSWTQIRKLTADDGSENDRFGYAVPMDGQTVAVGAYGNDDAGESTGAVYVFDLGETEVGQCSVETPVDPVSGESKVTLYFSQIIRAGETAVTLSSTGPAIPSGYQLGDPPTFFEIETTADYVGDVEICVDYSDVSYTNENALTLLHFEDDNWADLCEETPDNCTIDTGANIICAIADSLSPFVVAEKSSLFDNVTAAPGHGTSQAVFLSESFSAVGDQALIDVFIPSVQPNPNWIGQVQMTATIPSKGITGASMGVVQLTGRPSGQWSTLTFSVPQAVRNAILTGVAAGFITIVADTPSNAQPLIFNNFRFSGNFTYRSGTAPSRGSIDELFSFEAAASWTATSATLSSDTAHITDGASSLKVQRTGTDSVVNSADFITDEISSVGNTLTVDVYNTAQFSWGQVQANLSCPVGSNIYIGQTGLTGLAASAFQPLSIALPAAVKTALSTPGQICSISLTINAATGPVLYLDNLEIR